MRKYRRGEVLKIKIASYFSQMGPKSFSYILPTSNYLAFSFLQTECYRNHLSFSSRHSWLKERERYMKASYYH